MSDEPWSFSPTLLNWFYFYPIWVWYSHIRSHQVWHNKIKWIRNNVMTCQVRFITLFWKRIFQIINVISCNDISSLICILNIICCTLASCNYCDVMTCCPHYCSFVREIHWLSHWGRDKMAAISQMTLLNAFPWTKMVEFRLRFHCLFPRFQSIISQHWFRWWLGSDQATSHYLSQWWLASWHIYA